MSDHIEPKPRYGFNDHDNTKIEITPRDRLYRAWEDCMEHAREFKRFALMYEGSEAGDLFKDAAEKQGRCAADFHDILLRGQDGDVEI